MITSSDPSDASRGLSDAPGGDALGSSGDPTGGSNTALIALDALSRCVAAARAEGREWLFEHEAYSAAEALGLRVPQHVLVRDAEDAADTDLSRFPGERVVVKVVAPGLTHKSDAGGVAFVDHDNGAIVEAVRAMQDRFAAHAPRGYLVCEFVPHDLTPGGELLLGMRWTEDFGAVVSFGLGGVHAEFLSQNLVPGRDVAILSPQLHLGKPRGSAAEDWPGVRCRRGPSPRAGLSLVRGAATPDPVAADLDPIDAALDGKVVTQLVTGSLRNEEPRLDRQVLREVLRRALELARTWMPYHFVEFEMNPLVPVPDGLVALDARARLGRVSGHDGSTGPEGAPASVERPLHKIARLLEPRSIAIVGVSDRMNPGHFILNNILGDGFDPERVYVVKPGRDCIEGCLCVPDIASLPESVDLLVVSVDAAQVPDVVEAVIAARKAESLILIPGGLGETGSSTRLVRRMQAALQAARESDWQGPVVNGGNCLGIRSVPGRYDTLFIPRHKLGFPAQRSTPVALLCQSGAFAVARASKLPWMNPRYLVSLGNQMDLTVGDFLSYLKDDPELHVYACYVEGFRPLDGDRWLAAAAEITASGRPVILYRAGRTASGARAAASHTAAIAGNYAVTRELARAAGVLVADSLADFEDLLQLCCLLRDKDVHGMRLGALSNAGFECVAIADGASAPDNGSHAASTEREGLAQAVHTTGARAGAGFTLCSFTEATVAAVGDLLARCRLESIGSVRNPMDVTPIFDDEPFERSAGAVIDDPNADVAVIGCVPLTGALETLAAREGHSEDVTRPASVARRLGRLHRRCRKAWIAVVDAGPDYDCMVRQLQEEGVPTFRTADRAMRLFTEFCSWRLAHPARRGAPAQPT